MLGRAITLALASTALALSACGGTASNAENDFHAGFMNSCTRKGTQSMCQCFYDKLRARYSLADAVKRVKSGQLTRAEMLELGRPCLSGAARG